MKWLMSGSAPRRSACRPRRSTESCCSSAPTCHTLHRTVGVAQAPAHVVDEGVDEHGLGRRTVVFVAAVHAPAATGGAERAPVRRPVAGAGEAGRVDQRLEQPGDDVFTGISQWRENPRFKHKDEIVGMAELVFFGGQDTVASQMGFAMQRLAERPQLQQRLKDDPDIIPAAVEEFLRRHGLSNTGRLVRQDLERKGATM